MAKTPRNVHAFLEDLPSQLQPNARAELERLKQLKEQHPKAQPIEFDGKPYVWDFPYYHRLIQYSVNQDDVAEFFSMQSVIPAMLGLFEHVLGLCFKQYSHSNTGLLD